MNGERILYVGDKAGWSALGDSRNLMPLAVDFSADGVSRTIELLLANKNYAVVLVDMPLAAGDAVELLEKIGHVCPKVVRILMAADCDYEAAIAAVNRGHIFHLVRKPATLEALGAALASALAHYTARQAERDLWESTLTGSIKMLTDVLGLAAPNALGRGQHLRDSILRLARCLGIESAWKLEVAALLSQIGNAAIPPSVLQRQEAGALLRPDEMRLLQAVPQIGHDLLADIPRLAEVAEIVLYQHKHFDGSGFPADSVSGAAIPLGGRLLKILHDRLDLEADGVVKQRALDAMAARTGVYDPTLLVQCFSCLDEFLVNALTADRPVLSLHARELHAGHVTVCDIVTPEGLTLVSAGHRLTAATIRRIRNFAALGEVKEPLLVQEAHPDTVPEFTEQVTGPET